MKANKKMIVVQVLAITNMLSTMKMSFDDSFQTWKITAGSWDKKQNQDADLVYIQNGKIN